ncbi:hypothetical protein NZK33_14010 [Cyanobium sp. FGCU-6]|nr:hypothetical protein [Cyanobium sp. FGCU6]
MAKVRETHLQQMKTGFVVAALAALTTVVVDAGGSKAAIFTVGGQDYDVTTFSGSYNANLSKFATPANGGVMPWWGNQTLALEFSAAVNNSLGMVNNLGSTGPLFAWDYNFALGVRTANYTNLGANQLGSVTFLNTSYNWAQATLVPPAPVPGPLPILGAATAFGMSRRLRHRIATQPQKL